MYLLCLVCHLNSQQNCENALDARRDANCTLVQGQVDSQESAVRESVTEICYVRKCKKRMIFFAVRSRFYREDAFQNSYGSSSQISAARGQH